MTEPHPGGSASDVDKTLEAIEDCSFSRHRPWFWVIDFHVAAKWMLSIFPYTVYFPVSCVNDDLVRCSFTICEKLPIPTLDLKTQAQSDVMLPSSVFLMNRDQLAPNAHFPKHMPYVPLLSFTILRPHMIKLAASGATDRIGACSPVWPQRLLCFSILCCHCCLGSQIGLAVMLSHEVLSSLGKQLHSNRAVEVLKQMEQRKLRTDVPWTKIFKVWMFRCSFLGKKWSAGIPKWFLKLIFFCRSKLWLWLDLCDAHLLVVGHVFSVFFRGLP